MPKSSLALQNVMLSSDVKNGAIARIALDPMGQELSPAKQTTMERARKALRDAEQALANAKKIARSAAIKMGENRNNEELAEEFDAAWNHVKTLEGMVSEVRWLVETLDLAFKQLPPETVDDLVDLGS